MDVLRKQTCSLKGYVKIEAIQALHESTESGRIPRNENVCDSCLCLPRSVHEHSTRNEIMRTRVGPRRVPEVIAHGTEYHSVCRDLDSAHFEGTIAVIGNTSLVMS